MIKFQECVGSTTSTQSASNFHSWPFYFLWIKNFQTFSSIFFFTRKLHFIQQKVILHQRHPHLVQKKKKKKKNKTHRTVEETLVLAADNLIIHSLKLSKIKWRESLKFFLSKENKKANYESLKHFAWMLCCQHILGTWSLFILC